MLDDSLFFCAPSVRKKKFKKIQKWQCRGSLGNPIGTRSCMLHGLRVPMNTFPLTERAFIPCAFGTYTIKHNNILLEPYAEKI